MIADDTEVWHVSHGHGVVRKTHKNGRVSVAFDSQLLPKTVDEADLSRWEPPIEYLGGDYE